MYEFYNDPSTNATIEAIKLKVDTIDKFRDIREVEELVAQRDIIHAVSSIVTEIIQLLDTLPERFFLQGTIDSFCEDYASYGFVLQAAYDDTANAIRIEKAYAIQAYKCIETIKKHLKYLIEVIEKQKEFDRMDYEFDSNE